MRILVSTAMDRKENRPATLDLETLHHTVRITVNGLTYEIACRHGQLEIRGINTTLAIEPVGANSIFIAPGRPI